MWFCGWFIKNYRWISTFLILFESIKSRRNFTQPKPIYGPYLKKIYFLGLNSDKNWTISPKISKNHWLPKLISLSHGLTIPELNYHTASHHSQLNLNNCKKWLIFKSRWFESRQTVMIPRIFSFRKLQYNNMASLKVNLP